MLLSRKLKTATSVAAVSLLAISVASSVQADTFAPVTNWVHFVSVTSHDTANIHTATGSSYDATSNSPWFGNGTTDSANNYTAYGIDRRRERQSVECHDQPGRRSDVDRHIPR